MPDATATGDIGGAPQGVRAHAQLLADVSRIARNHLEESGAPGLSVGPLPGSSALPHPRSTARPLLSPPCSGASSPTTAPTLSHSVYRKRFRYRYRPNSTRCPARSASASIRTYWVLGVTQRAKLFGMISFELFGTFNTVFDDANALFAASLDLDLTSVGVI